ncbi:uncharacterized protein LOC144826567 [Lissotriton helveticus]
MLDCSCVSISWQILPNASTEINAPKTEPPTSGGCLEDALKAFSDRPAAGMGSDKHVSCHNKRWFILIANEDTSKDGSTCVIFYVRWHDDVEASFRVGSDCLQPPSELNRNSGEISRRRTRETEGTAPERDDSQEPGPSAENVTEDTGVPTTQPPSQDPEMSPHLQAPPERSGSPLLLSSPELPASLPLTTPASQKSRRHVVAPLVQMESSAGDMEGDDTQTSTGEGSPATQQSSAEVGRTGTRRRRHRESIVAARVEGSSVFHGLEGSMVKILRMQGKASQSVQCQMSNLNTNMEDIGKGIRELVDVNKEMAAGMRDMTQSVQLLCSKLDQDMLARRKERQRAQQQSKAINRLATATSLLCRRCINMQEGLTHNSNEVSRGIARMTSAVEVLINAQTAQTAALDVPESEESTSRSSMTSPFVVETRRSSRRHGEPTAQTHSEESQPLISGTGRRGRK